MSVRRYKPRNADASPVINHERCSGCGDCVDFCRAGVLSMEPSSGKPQVKHPERCTGGCRTCARVCPTGAATFRDEEVFIQYLRERLAGAPTLWAANGYYE